MILSEAALNSVQELVNCVEKLSSLSSERLLQIEKCPSNLHRQTDPYDKKRITKRYKKWLKHNLELANLPHLSVKKKTYSAGLYKKHTLRNRFI